MTVSAWASARVATASAKPAASAARAATSRRRCRRSATSRAKPAATSWGAGASDEGPTSCSRIVALRDGDGNASGVQEDRRAVEAAADEVEQHGEGLRREGRIEQQPLARRGKPGGFG